MKMNEHHGGEPGRTAEDLERLYRLRQGQPGQSSTSARGVGISPHMSGELLKSTTGINIIDAPIPLGRRRRWSTCWGSVALGLRHLPGPIDTSIPASCARRVATPNVCRRVPDVPAIAETCPVIEANARRRHRDRRRAPRPTWSPSSMRRSTRCSRTRSCRRASTNSAPRRCR